MLEYRSFFLPDQIVFLQPGIDITLYLSEVVLNGLTRQCQTVFDIRGGNRIADLTGFQSSFS